MQNFEPRPLMTVSPKFRPFPTQVNSLLNFQNTGLPSQSDYLFLHNRVGIYPTAGPHMIMREPALMNEHIEQLMSDIEKSVPVNFDGVIVLDYSIWSPLWHMTRNDCARSDGADDSCGDYDDLDHDFQDDWEEAWQHVDPAKARNWKDQGDPHYYKMLAKTYNQACRDFFVQTVQSIKDARPNAKVGFLGHVFGPWNSDGTPNDNYEQDNRDMQWLHQLSDVIIPRFSFELTQSIDGEEGVLLSDYRKLVRDNTRAAWVIAMDLGKDIRPFFPLQYSNPEDKHFGKTLFSPVLQTAIDEAYAESCHGCFVWYGLASQKNVDDIQSYLKNQLAPVIDQLGDGTYIDPEDKYEMMQDARQSREQEAEDIRSVEAQSAAVDERLSEAEEMPVLESYTASEDFSAFFGKEGITFTIPYEAIRKHMN